MSKYQSNVDMVSKEDLLSDVGMKRRSKYFMFTLTTLSTLGGFLFGYDTGVVSGAMLLINKDFDVSPVWHELIVSSTIGAALVFSLVGGWFSDRYGRRTAILVSGVIFTLGGIVMGAAPSKEVLLVGRIIIGIGVGLTSVATPQYMEEISTRDASPMPTFVTLIALGQAVAALMCGAFADKSYNGWRYMLGLAAVPSLVQFIGFCLMPESPRWLASQKKYAEAVKVLTTFRGSTSVAEQELSAIRATIEEKDREMEEQIALNGGSSLFMQVFKSPGVRRALLIGFCLQAFQQLSGINTVMYYSASIIRMSGVRDESLAIWISAGVAAVNCGATFIGLFLVDRVGRRKLVLLSYIGVIVSLALLGIGFHMMEADSPLVTSVIQDDKCGVTRTCGECISVPEGCGFCFVKSQNGTILEGSCWKMDPDTSRPLDGQCSDNIDLMTKYPANIDWANGWCPSQYYWLPILAMTVYLVSFAPGMGPMPWTINSEIYPLWARGFCTSITTSASWFGNLIISASFLSLLEALGKEGAFFLYVGIALVGFTILFSLLPETKGRTLEEMESLFLGPWFVCCRGRRSGSHLGSNNVQKEREAGQVEVQMTSTSTHM
ncbi:proton myo-inositol cotransporter-like isoform X3 [Thrips palmi]|uniref:Proton myo-inositol cotransporter-like isoform X3 n=1 Tax=Thrips palmi TaxID=161013 RepID=A0A6P9AH58_THRPL|nr:proton myo-inositol cotransporter-like isoform X3 [Thrips palmi]